MAVTGAELQRFLRDELVYFKVPRRVQFVEALPRGLTGKVLRHRGRRLRPAAQRRARLATGAVAAQLEQDVLAIWRRLLKTDAVGPEDNFLDSGGDSLLATEMSWNRCSVG